MDIIDINQYVNLCFLLQFRLGKSKGEGEAMEIKVRQNLPRRRLICGLSSFILLAGCEVPAPQVIDPSSPSGLPAPFVESVPKGRAVVVVLRGREFGASANAWRLSVNGTPVADLDTGMRYKQVVMPGPVQLKAETVPSIVNFGLGLVLMEKPVINITARAGEVYIFELDPAFAGGPKFVERDSSALGEAAKYIDAPLPAR